MVEQMFKALCIYVSYRLLCLIVLCYINNENTCVCFCVCVLAYLQSGLKSAHYKCGGVREAGELLHRARGPQMAEARTVW